MHATTNYHRRSDGPDAALIRALHDAPRASVSALAASLNEPRAAVAVQLRRLLDDGALQIVGAVNPGFAGLDVLAHVSIATHGTIAAVTALATSFESIVFVSAVGGEFDVVMEVRVHTHDELYALLARFRAHPDVARLATVIYSRVVRGTIAHDSFDPIEIDDVDTAIIRMLEHDGRAGYRALADGVGLSPSAVRSRLGRLLASRILKIGVVEARGTQGRRLSMGVGLGLSNGGEDAIELLRTAEFVDFASESVGVYDAVVTIAGDSPAALHDGLETLRRYPGVARSASWMHLRSIKENYARRV